LAIIVFVILNAIHDLGWSSIDFKQWLTVQ